jgi:isoamylase
VRFDVYAHAELGVELLLFGDVEDAEPQQVLPLDPLGDGYWGRFVPGLEAGQLYGYRVLGGVDLERGLRSDPEKLLMDPYARGIGQPRAFSRAAASRPGSNFGQALKSVVLDVSSFDWSGIRIPVTLGPRPSSMRCTWAGLLVTRARACPMGYAARIWG